MVRLKYPTVIEAGKTLVDYIAEFARVSNPTAKYKSSNEALCNYLLEHKHWSPFEMVNVVLEVETTRDIARQILRHKSFSFQEYSQRYSATETVGATREARMQDHNNRQSSLPCGDPEVKEWWNTIQKAAITVLFAEYDKALKKGIAKEVARAILPEGLTYTRLFMNGNIRSWIHYIEARTQPETQKEHREIARECAVAIEPLFPMIRKFVAND